VEREAGPPTHPEQPLDSVGAMASDLYLVSGRLDGLGRPLTLVYEE